MTLATPAAMGQDFAKVWCMALYFPGKSPCSVCGVVLEPGGDAVLHPAILSADHPLWRFSDSAMHRACYEDWEHHVYVETPLRMHREIRANRPLGRDLGEIEEWLAQTSQEFNEFLRSTSSIAYKPDTES